MYSGIMMHKAANMDDPAAWANEGYYFGEMPEMLMQEDQALGAGWFEDFTSALTPVLQRGAQVRLARRLGVTAPPVAAPAGAPGAMPSGAPMVYRGAAPGIFSGQAGMALIAAAIGIPLFVVMMRRGRRR